MNKVLLYGSGDFGKIVKNILKSTDYVFAGYISDIEKGDDIVGDYDYLIRNVNKNEYGVIITVGYSDLINRMNLYEKVLESGFRLPNIIHKNSRIDPSVRLGNGNIIMAGTDIDFNSVISDIVVVWPGSVISHDSKVKSNVFLSPNCTVCGYAEIEKNTFVGAGSVIIDRCLVKENSFIKAGSIYKGN